ncbi:UNVERIFIED_CONTAM: hypothetical protein FKN15_008633 [Acipenser sinensis]
MVGVGKGVSRGQDMGGEGGKVVKSLRMSAILEEKEAKSSAEMVEGGGGGAKEGGEGREKFTRIVSGELNDRVEVGAFGRDECRREVSFFLFIIFVVYTMLPFCMRDAIIASVLTSSSHTIVLSICLSTTAVIKEHLVWQKEKEVFRKWLGTISAVVSSAREVAACQSAREGGAACQSATEGDAATRSAKGEQPLPYPEPGG